MWCAPSGGQWRVTHGWSKCNNTIMRNLTVRCCLIEQLQSSSIFHSNNLRGICCSRSWHWLFWCKLFLLPQNTLIESRNTTINCTNSFGLYDWNVPALSCQSVSQSNCHSMPNDEKQTWIFDSSGVCYQLRKVLPWSVLFTYFAQWAREKKLDPQSALSAWKRKQQ